MKSCIFKRDFEHRYNRAFQEYVIHAYYGDNILIGEDLMKKEDAEE